MRAFLFIVLIGSLNLSYAQNSNMMRLRSTEEATTIYSGEHPVMSYVHEETLPPEEIDPIYKRSAYIHPLWSPGGEVLTRIQPPDHYHHYGIWNPWTKTHFGERKVDFWNIADGQGTVRFAEYLEKSEERDYAGFKVRHDHIFFPEDGTEQVAINEIWDIKVRNTEKNVFVVDLTTTLNTPLENGIVLEAYRYGGGLGFRATEKWHKDNSTVLTSEGKTRKDADGTSARWCIIEGESVVPEGRSGILFLSHPSNRAHPEPMRIWPLDANNGRGDMFFEFCPIRHQEWNLEHGKDHTLKYRMVIFDGVMEAESAEKFWQEFAGRKRILIYTKNGEGYVHENIAASVAAFEKICTAENIATDVSDQPGVFTPSNLAQYDAIVFCNSNNEGFDTEDQKQAFQDFIRDGKGFAAIHSANATERQWPWYWALVGGKFIRHAPYQEFDVLVTDPDHPSTSPLPRRWTIEDECYYSFQLNPDIHVLLSADLTTVEDEKKDEYPGETFGQQFPLCWYHHFEGGRQWYTALGHNPEFYSDPTFIAHLRGGILWILGKE